MFRGWSRAAGRNYPAGTWNHHRQRRFLPRSLLTAKPSGFLTFSWYPEWFPPGCSGHNKVTAHLLTENTTGIYGCIISTSSLWQSLKNVLKSNKTTKIISIRHRHHVILLLVTLSQILQGIFTTHWCTVLSHCCTTAAQEQLRVAELAGPRAFVVTSDLWSLNCVVSLHRISADFLFLVSWWKKCNMNGSDTPLLPHFLHYSEHRLVFCMVALKTESKSRFINREWVTHHQNANSLFSGGLNFFFKLHHYIN